MAVPIPPPNITSSSSAATRAGPVTVGGLNIAGSKSDMVWPVVTGLVVLAAAWMFSRRGGN